MTTKYLVELRLACSSLLPRAQKKLDKRWPRSLERRWRNRAFNVGCDLELELNKLILVDCFDHIASDLGELPLAVKAFEAGQWRIGSRGRYESWREIEVQTPSSLLPWTLHFADSLSATICAHASMKAINY